MEMAWHRAERDRLAAMEVREKELQKEQLKLEIEERRCSLKLTQRLPPPNPFIPPLTLTSRPILFQTVLRHQ